jgi:hypothetical protein
VYVQAEPAPAQEPRTPTSYWYYCTDPAGYYPYVQRCKVAWTPVVPQNVPPDVANPPAVAK